MPSRPPRYPSTETRNQDQRFTLRKVEALSPFTFGVGICSGKINRLNFEGVKHLANIAHNVLVLFARQFRDFAARHGEGIYCTIYTANLSYQIWLQSELKGEAL